MDLITINKKGKNKAQGTAQEHLMSRGLVEEENPTKTLLDDLFSSLLDDFSLGSELVGNQKSAWSQKPTGQESFNKEKMVTGIGCYWTMRAGNVEVTGRLGKRKFSEGERTECWFQKSEWEAMKHKCQ